MVSPVNASRQSSRTAAHHSGPGRLARPYPVVDFHLLSFASLSWRTLLLARSGSTNPPPITAAVPLIAEVRRPLVRFRRVPSARPPGADAQDGGADSPNLTPSRHQCFFCLSARSPRHFQTGQLCCLGRVASTGGIKNPLSGALETGLR
jgi:hypothetical protein